MKAFNFFRISPSVIGSMGIIFAVFGFGFLSRLPAQKGLKASAQTDSNAIAMSVSDWRNDNEGLVILQPSAAAAIKADVLRQEPAISKMSIQNWDTTQKTEFIVKSYLADIRDKKLADANWQESSTSKVTIGSRDVRNQSFASFFDKLLRDPGALSVTSFPRGARIVIDSAARGMTDRDFVVSKGRHSVSVKSHKCDCTEDVDVEDQPVVVQCPKL